MNGDHGNTEFIMVLHSTSTHFGIPNLRNTSSTAKSSFQLQVRPKRPNKHDMQHYFIAVARYVKVTHNSKMVLNCFECNFRNGLVAPFVVIFVY